MRLLPLLLLSACQGARPEAPPPRSAVDPDDPATLAAAPVKALTPLAVGPAAVEVDVLRVGVPSGWVAWSVDGGVRVRHSDGTEVVVVLDASGDVPAWSGCAWRFQDGVGRYREVPELDVLRVAHCEAERVDADLVQVWMGEIRGTRVRVERHLPAGSLVSGMDAASEVLAGIRPRD